MKSLPFLTAFSCLACACAQPVPKPPAPASQPDWLEAKWRARITQDLKRKGIQRSANDPVVMDLAPVLTELKKLLPDGKLILHTPDDGRTIRFINLQVQTTLDETEKTRFVRVLDTSIEEQKDAGAAEERLVKHLRTPAIYEAGPVQGPEPGQLCYHFSDKVFGEHEIFIRENVLVAVHCMGPTDIAKKPVPFNPRIVPHEIGERTSVPSQCNPLCPDLAFDIDRLIQQHLRQR